MNINENCDELLIMQRVVHTISFEQLQFTVAYYIKVGH